jgi:hypothetical protein
MVEEIRELELFPSAARTATVNGSDVNNWRHRGVRLWLDITVVSGTTPTLDVKVQSKDHISGKYVDIPSAAFVQKTATGSDDLLVYPGVAETANRSVSDVLPKTFRVVATIGGTTPSFTFSLSGELLP